MKNLLLAIFILFLVARAGNTATSTRTATRTFTSTATVTPTKTPVPVANLTSNEVLSGNIEVHSISGVNYQDLPTVFENYSVSVGVVFGTLPAKSFTTTVINNPQQLRIQILGPLSKPLNCSQVPVSVDWILVNSNQVGGGTPITTNTFQKGEVTIDTVNGVKAVELPDSFEFYVVTGGLKTRTLPMKDFTVTFEKFSGFFRVHIVGLTNNQVNCTLVPITVYWNAVR